MHGEDFWSWTGKQVIGADEPRKIAQSIRVLAQVAMILAQVSMIFARASRWLLVTLPLFSVLSRALSMNETAKYQSHPWKPALDVDELAKSPSHPWNPALLMDETAKSRSHPLKKAFSRYSCVGGTKTWRRWDRKTVQVRQENGAGETGKWCRCDFFVLTCTTNYL